MQEDATGRKPLVITDRAGRILEVTSMNRKGFTKSTEQGELWLLHGDTGRVLPYEGEASLAGLSDEGGWYQAVVEPAGKGGRATSGEPASRAAGAGQAAGSAPGQAPAGSPPRGTGGASGESDATAVLGELCAVIAQRRLERPEGSYTTYLFDSGEEKIRKKTGEEAIELVLARRRDEVVSEAADLIYHLLVLLNQLDIPLDEVVGELARRA